MTHCRVTDCGATTNAVICKPCCSEIERALGDFQSMLAELSNLATRQTRVYRANGTTRADDEVTDAEYVEAERWEWLALEPIQRSSTAKSALPSTPTMVNLGARDLYDASINMLSTWARHLNESGTEWSRRVHGNGFIVTLRGEAPDTTQAIIAWLMSNLNAIRFDEAAAEIHREITRQHARIRRAVDRIPSRVFAGPCDTEFPDHADVCRRPLYASPQPHFDDDLSRLQWELDNPIVCDGYRPPFDRSDSYDPEDEGCGAIHERSARRAWMLDDLEDRLLPLSLLQDALPEVMGQRLSAVPPSSIVKAWVRQGRLVPHTVIDGIEFFRGGDLITLMLAYKPKTFAHRPNRRRMSA